MRNFRRYIFAMQFMLLTGCSAGTNVDPVTAPIAGPHGGVAYPLPDGSGYAEIFVERGKATGRTAGKAMLSVYFLAADRKAALTPPPSDVSATVVTPEKAEPTPVTLALTPIAKEPLSTARFASESGAFDYDELRGELKATISGKPFQREFAIR